MRRPSAVVRAERAGERRIVGEVGDAEVEPEGTTFEIAPLGDDPPAARIEAKAGKVLVTNGPFAETKELIGGYSLVRAKGRAAAIELDKRYPHARWGPIKSDQDASRFGGKRGSPSHH